MPSIRKRVTVPASGVPIFPLQGDQYEFLPFPARVQFAMVGDTVAAGGVDVSATVYSGSDILQMNGPIAIKASTNPVFPDDFLLDDVAGAGERLNIVLTKVSAGTTTVDVAVIITPI
jgi:hypothetical protein